MGSMRMPLALSVLASALACAAPPADQAAAPLPARPLHTFSIVARDPQSGQLGVAVQSHWFNVGPLVAWAEAGVGAVATQSFVNVSFGPRGLELMRAGKPPADALRELIASDPGEAVRQVALVDAKGRVAAHTGARCIAWAGHTTGDGFSAQANMMEGDGVVAAMSAAFEAAEGELAERLLAALDAAQAAGGDIRGQQSAALKVVAAARSGDPSRDVLVDLRVEDHPAPIAELRRLYDVHRAYASMNAGDAALEHADLAGALAAYGRAAELQPANVEIRFWSAFTLATNERLAEALPIFRGVFAADARWAELLQRLPAAGLCGDALVEQILAETRPAKDGR